MVARSPVLASSGRGCELTQPIAPKRLLLDLPCSFADGDLFRHAVGRRPRSGTGCVNGIPERNANWLLFFTTNELDNPDGRPARRGSGVSLVPRMGSSSWWLRVATSILVGHFLSVFHMIQFDNVIELTAPVTSPQAGMAWQAAAALFGSWN